MRAEIYHYWQPHTKETISRPDWLWYLLSFTTLLLFLALPLSGLTMEMRDVLIRASSKAVIFGPNMTTFNTRGVLDLDKNIGNLWQSGRATAPSRGALLYAPEGTKNVSDTYFNDQASRYAKSIAVFAGPAVHEPVSGSAWGMYANISCMPVAESQLQMLQVDDFNFATNACLYDDCSGTARDSCEFTGFRNTTEPSLYNTGCNTMAKFPFWVNVSDSSGLFTQFSYIAVADGSRPELYYESSPYTTNSHDEMTYDSIVRGKSKDEVTVAMFEFFLWQSNLLDDDVLANLTSGQYTDPVYVINRPLNQYRRDNYTNFAGIAIHCDLMSTVGYADLSPSHRTFSAFAPTRAIQSDSDVHGAIPPQVLAVLALTGIEDDGPIDGKQILTPDTTDVYSEFDQPWIALHTAIGSAALPPTAIGPAALPSTAYDPVRQAKPKTQYHALTPKDLQFAMYKLLGESVIALMDEGGVAEFQEGLYSMKSISYLIPGTVSWVAVLALLVIWALILVGGAFWIVFLAGPRWAPSLNGFEMFKFGAQYTQDVNYFRAIEFEGCTNALNRIPGMVGMLPGNGNCGNVNDNVGFVGLSESVASGDAAYALDRRQAARFRSA